MRALLTPSLLALAVAGAVWTAPASPALAQDVDAVVCNPVIDSERTVVIDQDRNPVRHEGTYDCPPEPAEAAITPEPEPTPTATIAADVLFDFDRYNIKPEFEPELNRVAQALIDNQQTEIIIAGHTDSVGTEAYNQGLSERRARSVADYMLSRGVQQGDIARVYGLGEAEPVASNDTREGRAQNRRVEIFSTDGAAIPGS